MLKNYVYLDLWIKFRLMFTVFNCSEGFSVIYYYRDYTGLKSTLNLEGFLEKSLKIKSALKSTRKSTRKP